MALGIFQGTISPAIWLNFNSHSTANALWDALKARFREAGGSMTYLQLVNMITIKMTDSDNLLTQVQEFQENYL